MLDSILHTLTYLGSFAFVLLVIVFIHEYGHYKVAKSFGVKIEIFSIGFGKELFGWNDASGTRWKVCAVPLGGYVKMFGDINPASAPDKEKVKKLTKAEKKIAFQTQSLWKKALIVAAGPFANFILAFVLLSGIFYIDGKPYALPVISEVVADSAADRAGLQPDDYIHKIDGNTVSSFGDIQRIIALNTGTSVTLSITRNDSPLDINVTPDLLEQEDIFGNKMIRPLLGIRSLEHSIESLTLLQSFTTATTEVYNIASATLTGVKQMILGTRSVKEISGPIGIAKYSGEAAKNGIESLLMLIIIISVNLGLVNLFPIPVLDGGHLLYYAIETIQGKPLAEKFQEWGLRLGIFLIAILTIFAIVNDIRKFL